MAMVVLVVVTIMGASLMTASSMNALETSRYLNSVKAFWLADAGAQRFDKRAYDQNWTGFTDTSLGGGTIQVTVYSNSSPPYAECVGVVQGSGQRLQVQYQYLAPSFNEGIFSGNSSSNNWYFTLRGNGTTNMVGGHLINGRDMLMGDLFINGNVALYEQSMVSNSIAPNTYQTQGDITSTGTIGLNNSATNTGGRYQNQTNQPIPDVKVMKYESNNTWNVAREFAKAGITSGRLPSTHPLYNIVVKNPSTSTQRIAQVNSTTNVDDYYFEPAGAYSIFRDNQFRADYPFNLGSKTIYYVDGNVWVNSDQVFGFAITGTSTIVSTRDFHLGDNFRYATTNDLLGLIAIGTYNSSGQLVDGGNIYFGDPTWGTLYTADAFMFAANNFYYNTSSTDPTFQQEPKTGFKVYGNYAALNQVTVYRDWYDYSYTTNSSTTNQYTHVITYNITTNSHAAWYDPSTSRWRDVLDTNMFLAGNAITSYQTNTLRHYQMVLRYDERIRRQSTQPPRLPGLQTGASGYYGGITRWQQVPY